MSRIKRKPVFGDLDQVKHKLVCMATEDGYKLESFDLGSRWIGLSM